MSGLMLKKMELLQALEFFCFHAKTKHKLLNKYECRILMGGNLVSKKSMRALTSTIINE